MKRDKHSPWKYVRVIGKKAFVELTRGKTAIIDAADAHLVDHRLWQARRERDGAWYARSSKQGTMHRVILGLDQLDDVVVDHIDGDGLNNCRSSLRVCENRQNVRNSKKRTVAGTAPTSKFKGVSKIKGRNGWRAQIMRDGIKINLGHYQTQEMAARVYDMAAREYFGEFARTNFEESAA